MNNILCTNQNHNLLTLLAQTRDVLFMVRQKELRRVAISATKSAALCAIQAIGYEATPSEISRRLFRRPHSVSCLLQRMEKEGLIRRTKDLDRKNLIRVTLTDKGYEYYYQSLKQGLVDKILYSLSEQEREDLGSTLQKLRDKALSELGVEPQVSVLAMSL